MFDEDGEPAKGFDKSLNYEECKKALIESFNYILSKNINTDKDIDRLIYIVISMIQLRNGSRISETIKAYYKFSKEFAFGYVTVKISKSDKLHYNEKEEEWIKLKPRYRKIVFPNWIDKNTINVLNEARPNYLENANDVNLIRKRVLRYITDKFQWNTHSLRYAYINYCLFILNKPQSEVAKIVGHVNVNMMVKYTQQHKIEETLFDHDKM